jgi:hypothetical protein
VFVLAQTAFSAPPMQAPSKQASMNTTTLLFKKQWLWLNPSFQQHHTNNMNTHSIEYETMNDDDVSPLNDKHLFLACSDVLDPSYQDRNNTIQLKD